ncbi:hypothetical protein [Hyphomicrobium sp.]|uniref:hypothetical protein n=1 Tax=Hyphomicrobium sp. TaxID=82 RepID=UPI0025BA785A|nr:hypothetical protein [Hyphomicrobium sp.]MCC7251601.1 hypothetical protein [Hyphomicrobium sp.]
MLSSSDFDRVQGHFASQAQVLKRYQWGSIAVAVVALAFLAYEPSTLAMVAFVVGFVYWRDTRNRQQALERAVLEAPILMQLADKVDRIAGQSEPRANPIKEYLASRQSGGG